MKRKQPSKRSKRIDGGEIKVNHDSDLSRLLAFMKECDDVPQTINGFGITIDHYSPQLTMSVSIPEDASEPQLREAWPIIRAWRKRLNAFNEKHHGKQFPETWPDFLRRTFDRKLDQHRNDKPEESYADIAEAVNRHIMTDLETAFFLEESWGVRHKALRGRADPMIINALDRIRDILSLLKVQWGLTEYTGLEDMIVQAKARYHNESRPFESLKVGRRKPRLNGPVIADDVRNLFHKYRHKK